MDSETKADSHKRPDDDNGNSTNINYSSSSSVVVGSSGSRSRILSPKMTSNTLELDSNIDDVVDPRVAIELESLNSATNEINNLEKELENANAKFRQLLTRTSSDLESLAKRIGSSIDRARPFYEALTIAQNAHRACLAAATQFSRANGVHSAAKTTVALTESKFNSKCLDSVYQEVLNHATMKVMEAEKMKKDSQLEHRTRADEFTVAESRVHALEKHLSREIERSRPYFELKNQLNINLAGVKTEIENIQLGIGLAKKTYAESLKRLECISEEIHFQRSHSNSKNGRTIPSSDSESPDVNSHHHHTHSRYPSTSSKDGIFLLRRTSPIGAEADAETDSECVRNLNQLNLNNDNDNDSN